LVARTGLTQLLPVSDRYLPCLFIRTQAYYYLIFSAVRDLRLRRNELFVAVWKLPHAVLRQLPNSRKPNPAGFLTGGKIS
jgi:hypothetical protein